jgi:hypothetical protein
MHLFQILAEGVLSSVTARNHTDSQPIITLEAPAGGLEQTALVIIFGPAEDKSQVSAAHSGEKIRRRNVIFCSGRPGQVMAPWFQQFLGQGRCYVFSPGPDANNADMNALLRSLKIEGP